MSHLTPNLLKLYVDIEFTGSHNAVNPTTGRGTVRVWLAGMLGGGE